MHFLSPNNIAQAHARLRDHVHRTPVLESSLLNRWLGHRLLFKAECMQKMGAFKFRGAMHTLLSLQESNQMPQKLVTVSSGNHAQAIALAAREFGIPATILTPSFSSSVKIQATRDYGAEVILTPTRRDAEAMAEDYARKGYVFIPPYDRDEVIAGQGTACFEALQDHPDTDAVFATCSGGGLLSGTYLAARYYSDAIEVYGAEPLNANDAAQSLREGIIKRFADTPSTLADGAAALSISERTFYYLKKLNGMFEVEETAIIYWTQWLTHLLKVVVEPTSAAAMAAAANWLVTQSESKTVLVILSGGNVAPETHRKLWECNRLDQLPSIM